MRKKTRRSPASTSPRKQALQLSRETVRTLTSEELSQVVQAGDYWTCPTGSNPPTTQSKITIEG
jgi:hypothetical protein